MKTYPGCLDISSTSRSSISPPPQKKKYRDTCDVIRCPGFRAYSGHRSIVWVSVYNRGYKLYECTFFLHGKSQGFPELPGVPCVTLGYPGIPRGTPGYPKVPPVSCVPDIISMVFEVPKVATARLWGENVEID